VKVQAYIHLCSKHNENLTPSGWHRCAVSPHKQPVLCSEEECIYEAATHWCKIFDVQTSCDVIELRKKNQSST
jgi:hypothetical protein